MTYGRARLWLGITGVGSLVTIATIAILTRLPHSLFSSSADIGSGEVLQLATLVGIFAMWLMPLDFLGGYLLPRMYRKSNQSFLFWFGRYSVAALSQSLTFIILGSLVMSLSQQHGLLGGVIAISLGIFCCVIVRNRLLLQRQVNSPASKEKLLDAIAEIQSWQTFVPRTVVVEHSDIGFTGGVVGIGKRAQILIPEAWLKFTQKQLGTAIARRAIAINSGSYARGLLIAFVWNLGGFSLCSLAPAAGLTTVAGIATTACYFTLWSFLGLLILPTLSRNASLKIDHELQQKGMPAELISKTAFTLDRLQDGEPDRARWIETIFHPVPNVTSRNSRQSVRGFSAWNVARTTLFFSWACLGFLSRSVHCNLGRPELWTMLPTD